MKRFLIFMLLDISCLHAMDPAVIHSRDNGRLLCSYWCKINTLNMDDMDGPEASLYCYLHTIAQHEPHILLLTPQQLANLQLPTIYKVLYAKKLPSTFFSEISKPLIVEEAARTIEGILNSLVKLKKQNKQ